jgi:hypothetical protein
MWYQRYVHMILKLFLIITITSCIYFGFHTLAALTAPEITWSRNYDPVIFNGADVPLLGGKNIAEIYAYRYSSGVWEQIPFQIDEVNPDGDYATEDGVLDLNDELVFMAKDLGDAAGAADWISDDEARNTIRYQLTITNPLNTGEVGYVYLYHSSALTPIHGDYVAWDAISETINAESYILGLKPDDFFGIDAMELNGSGVDMLDRSKIRVNALCNSSNIPFDEENITDLMGMALTPEIDGSVRVGGGNPTSNFWAYGSIFDINTVINIDAIDVWFCNPFSIEQLRFSFDLLNPADSGMSPATYYDSNSASGYPVNGEDDPVPGSPVNTWVQISGADASTVQVIDVSVGGGTISNYYKDDSTEVSNDKGDLMSFADAGIVIDNPTGVANFRFFEYILDPDASNVGSEYRDFYDNPLVMAVQAQTFQQQSVYLPIVRR